MGELIDVATAPRRGDTAVTTAARRAPTWAWLRARLPWWVAVAAAFTTVFVLLSVRVGRLQSPLHGDDMMYFLDGLDRLDQFRSKGLSGVVAGYVDRPPHSPWASFLAAGCFGLFGMREWAPFVGNGLLIMALVGFVDFLAIGRGPWSRRFCLFMACTAPFAAQAVMQFRPDFAAGLLTAIGVVLVLRSNFAESSRRHQAAAGVAFGLALLVKPTGSPFTLAMTGGTLVLATLCDWLTRPGLTVRQVASSWAWCVGPLLALAGPHYALAWRSVAKIVALNTTDPQAKVWTMSGGEVFPWYYYLTGLGGRMMLRNHLYLFGAICLASFVFVVRARDREAIVRHVAFGLVLLVAWAIPTMLGSFSPFFTQTFVVLLLFCAVLAVGDVMPRVSIGGPRSPWITRVAVAGAVVLPFVGMASRTSGVAPDPARIPAGSGEIGRWSRARLSHLQRRDRTRDAPLARSQGRRESRVPCRRDLDRFGRLPERDRPVDPRARGHHARQRQGASLAPERRGGGHRAGVAAGATRFPAGGDLRAPGRERVLLVRPSAMNPRRPRLRGARRAVARRDSSTPPGRRCYRPHGSGRALAPLAWRLVRVVYLFEVR